MLREKTKLRLVHGGKGTDGIDISDKNRAAYQPVGDADRAAKGILVRAHGNKAAAWLLWKHRKALVKLGYQDFHITKKDGLPRWFWVAIEYLKTERRETWLVRKTISGKTIRWRVTWKHFGTWKREATAS